jgi:hypothetical protein
MPGSFLHRRQPLRAVVWIFAAAACAACHRIPEQARVLTRPGAAPGSSGAQPAIPPAMVPEPAQPAPAEISASCGGPTIFHIVARATSISVPEHPGFTADGELLWRFRLEEIAARTVVTACIEPLPQGCVQTRVAELADDRWVGAAVPTTGLPPLAVVNLIEAPGTPFRQAFHEAGPPFEGDRQDLCDYYNMMEGTVSLTGLYGEWPDNAWAKVTFAEDHSGIPYDDLYRWDGTRWSLRYSPKRFGTYVDVMVPWRGGLAAVAVENAAVEPKRKLVYLGDRKRVLLTGQAGELRVGRVGDALVGASIERGAADVERVMVSRWTSPGSAPKTQVLAVPEGDQILWVSLGEETVTVHLVRDGARADAVWGFDGRWVLAELRAHGPEDEIGDPEEIDDPSECRDLTLAGIGALDIRERWRQGDRVWLEVTAPGVGETWLLRDRPARDVWEIPPETLIWPPRAQCPPGKIPEGSLERHGEW